LICIIDNLPLQIISSNYINHIQLHYIWEAVALGTAIFDLLEST